MSKWKNALITGGASGLGLGFTVRLLRRGTRVTVLDMRIPSNVRVQLDQAAAIGATSWSPLVADVTDENVLGRLVAAQITEFGRLDLVIHCAGVALNRAFAKTSHDDFRRLININLIGSFNLASAVIPHMNPGSRLALVASMAGITSNYAYSAYSASKFGVVGLATTLRYEYEPRGISISCICPPEVRTPMVVEERSPGNHDEIALVLKDMAGSLDLDVAVDSMLAQLNRGRWMVIPGIAAKLVAATFRYLPFVHFAVTHYIVRRELRKQKRAASLP
ncbi:SDR family NAD(P)-dependent oxidoreductase [Pseudomonas guguanensis]|uniref:SDR family NAD(P)-dependent oxidoreductase n=1 Tax=Ectopseudomonas guguanensis TaxID=1198456 RepID=UPI0032679CF9